MTSTARGRPFDVVITVGSLGAIGGYRELFGRLPATFPVPLLLVQHRVGGVNDRLPEILARRCPLEVRPAVEGVRLEPSTVTAAPGDARVVVDASLSISHCQGAEGDRAGDTVLRSAAALGPRVLAVVLSGRLDDGAAGVVAVKRAGGSVLVQEPATCEHPAMPLAALATGCVDLALPLDGLAAALVAYMQPGVASLLGSPLPSWAFGAAQSSRIPATG